MKIQACIVLLILCSASSLRAAFILDDYDDPAQTVMQSPFDTPYGVTTAGVGDLAASRRIAIIGSRGNPVGSMDADVSASSMLTTIVTELNPTPTTETDVFVWWDYDFDSTDLSESGQNNAFFFDFGRLTAEMPPSRLLITMDGDDLGFYVHQHFSVPLSSGPFTIVVPFSQIATRGGYPWFPESVNIHQLHFELRPTLISGGGADPLNLRMELDRIRVGRIPEPCASSMMLIALSVLLTARFRILFFLTSAE